MQQKNVRPWLCFYQGCLQADPALGVSQDRGYCVTRLSVVESIESPPAPSILPLPPRETRGNMIAFPQRPGSNLRNSADMRPLRALIETWLQLASPPSIVTSLPAKGGNNPAFEPLSRRKRQSGRFQPSRA